MVQNYVALNDGAMNQPQATLTPSPNHLIMS